MGVKRIVIDTTTSRVVHMSGFNATPDCEPSVLAVCAVLATSDDEPGCTAIVVGSPYSSPLMPGVLPQMTGFSCDPEAAEALGRELIDAASAVRASLNRKSKP